MNTSWREIAPGDFEGNAIKLIGSDWMLITSGTPERWNTMTASWGGVGELWGRDVCFCFVRPSRHTYQFMNEGSEFTLSFFAEEHRDALSYCGAHSGRDVDKAKETGLIPTPVGGSVAFEQAGLVLLCRKIYQHDIDPADFVDPGIESNYNGEDYHRQYIGEILSCHTV